MTPNKQKRQYSFATAERGEVPNGRKGKHHAIIAAILDDLGSLDKGRALKILLTELPDTKVNIRSALNRETRKLGRKVSTSADEQYLYVWNT